jgi:hypothetical protein
MNNIKNNTKIIIGTLKDFKMFTFLWISGMLSFALLFLYIGLKKPNKK